MDELKVFRGLPIPVGLAATMKYAILAKSGGGKTYCALKFEEQMCDAGMFFAVLDPVGKHWALRAGVDGEERGGKRDVYVLGGLHGDVELSPTSGALIADTVVDHPGRYVLDVSTFESDAEQDRFATDFAKRLFRRKAKDPGYPLMLVLEEAESFIPQVPRGNQSVMLGAFGKIARQGRNHGLGMLMVAQRSAALNKGVLSQADVLIAKEMSHNRDLTAIDEWVEANGTKAERDTLIGSLASLKVDEAWVWSPSWLRCFERTKVLRRTTFDSSASVEHGTAMKAVKLTPLDVESLGKHIAETAERAKAEDPKALKAQIAALARDLAEAVRERDIARDQVAEPVVTEHAVPTVPEGFSEKVERLARRASDLVGAANSVVDGAGACLEDIDGLREGLVSVTEAAASPPRMLTAPPAPRPGPPKVTVPARLTPPPAPRAASQNGNAGVALGKAERRILSVLAQYPGGRTMPQLALLTGYSVKSGGLRNALGALRSAGLVDRNQPIGITPEGSAAIAGGYEPLPRGEELFDYWLGRMGKAERAILMALRSGGEQSIDELAENTGYSPTSGGLRNALGKLRTLELVTPRQPISLTDEMVEAIT